MLKLADKPSCLGGGDKGKSMAQTGLSPNCSVEVRILLLQQKQPEKAAFFIFYIVNEYFRLNSVYDQALSG